jgi:hypothetical protein
METSMLESFTADARYAVRRLRHRPTYTALTVLTLALGVAGIGAVFGIAKRLLFEPLPLRAEEEIVVFWFGGAWSESELSYLRPEMNDFTSVAAIQHASPDDPTRLRRLAGRFASIALPEQTITTSIWNVGDGAYAYETANDAGGVVIKDGLAEFE